MQMRVTDLRQSGVIDMTRKVIAMQVPPEHQMSPWEYREPLEGLVIQHEESYGHITTYGEDVPEDRVIRLCENWEGNTDAGGFYEDMVELSEDIGFDLGKLLEVRKILEYYGDEDDYCEVLNLLVGGNWEHVEGHDFMQTERALFYYDKNLLDGVEDLITEYFNDGNEWEVTSYVDGVEEDRLMVYCHNAEDPLLEIAWVISADPDDIELEWYED